MIRVRRSREHRPTSAATPPQQSSVTRIPLLMAAALLLAAASCSSSEPTSDAADTETTTATASDATASEEAASEDAEPEPVPDDDVPSGGSGPDGIYLVGDTYTDGDFLFVYEGLVKVPLDPLGEYSDGECYFAVGSVTFIEGPSSAISDVDSFTPAFDPIIAGVADTEQSNEFFNCDAGTVGELGYSQGVTTDVTLGDTEPIWLDAIYLTPAESGQLDGFRLYASDDIVFEAAVTQDLSG